MKKLFALLLLGVLTSTAAYAVSDNPVTTVVSSTTNQATGQASVNFEDQTNFGKVAAWGNTTAGNPGYIALKGCDANNRCYPYYLWVASDGKVYVASYITISAYASFPSGSWNRNNMAVGTAVGSQ